MRPEMEPWEKRKTNSLMWRGLGAVIAGMILAFPVAVVLRVCGAGSWSSGLVTAIACMVAAIVMIRRAYHEGVCDERERGQASSDIEGASAHR